MHIAVRLFGGLVPLAGATTVEVDVADDATAAEVRDAVAAAHPTLTPMLARVKVAVDLEVVSDDARVNPGSEVALLPPVAGGAGAVDARNHEGVRILTGLSTPPLPVEEAISAITGPRVGAVVQFIGTVRDHAHMPGTVVRLDYSAYPAMAEKVLADIASAVVANHPDVEGVALLHAVGELDVGAHTILVACASAHREEAFTACRWALERVKADTPIWKHEHLADGTSRWVGLQPGGHSGS